MQRCYITSRTNPCHGLPPSEQGSGNAIILHESSRTVAMQIWMKGVSFFRRPNKCEPWICQFQSLGYKSILDFLHDKRTIVFDLIGKCANHEKVCTYFNNKNLQLDFYFQFSDSRRVTINCSFTLTSLNIHGSASHQWIEPVFAWCVPGTLMVRRESRTARMLSGLAT